MLIPSLERGITPWQADSLEAIGVDVAGTFTEAVAFQVLRNKGTVLHQPGCRALTGKETTSVHLTLVEVGTRSIHTCANFVWSQFTTDYHRAKDLLTIAEAVDAVTRLEATAVPAPARHSAILADLTSDVFISAVDRVGGNTDRVTDLRRRLDQVTKAWSGSPRTSYLRPFLVSTLAMPRDTTRHLSLDVIVRGRVAGRAWRAWQAAVASEDQHVMAVVAAAVSSEVDAMRRAGEAVDDPDPATVEALVTEWETLLSQDCDMAGREPDVLIAFRLGRPDPDAEAILATFHSLRSERHTAVVRCPLAVADWYADRSRNVVRPHHLAVYLGRVAEITQATLECFLGLWDPRGDGELADARAALRNARLL